MILFGVNIFLDTSQVVSRLIRRSF